MSSVYDQDVINNCQVRNWFSKSHFRDMSLRDEPRPGYSSNLDQKNFREPGRCIQLKIIRELALDLNTSLAQSAGAVEYTDCTSAEG